MWVNWVFRSGKRKTMPAQRTVFLEINADIVSTGAKYVIDGEAIFEDDK